MNLTHLSPLQNDFKLMCNNAMKYNKNGTVYHKAARKLLHIGLRQLQPAKLRPLGNILTYMYEIPMRELGFDMGKMDVVSYLHFIITCSSVDLFTPPSSMIYLTDHRLVNHDTSDHAFVVKKYVS